LSESKTNMDKTYKDIDSEDQSNSIEENDIKPLDDAVVEKAIELFRKVREGDNVDLTEKEIAEIDKECEIIRNRETVTKDLEHKPTEITGKNGQIVTGPPTLTRFERARIVGARALQLSLGAPVFIEIPKNATSSLEIAMEELKQRVIPIVIKRTLPNGDYQHLPIDKFE
jgi:DNA-directed RNA polymerase I, II, and III subunit RPABC2